MLVERPEPAWIDVTLSPEATKEARTTGLPQVLEGWLRLGLPIVRAVRAGELEPAAAAQLEADAGRYRYDLVQLACSLRPPDGERFRRAFLSVDLGESAAEPTIAFSMDPSGETVEAGRSTSLGFTANLGLVSVSASHERTATRQVARVLAHDVRTPHPSWELSASDGHDLIGSYHFALLARSPVGARVIGRVGLSATVERWRFVRLEAAYPEGRQVQFEIGGSP